MQKIILIGLFSVLSPYSANAYEPMHTMMLTMGKGAFLSGFVIGIGVGVNDVRQVHWKNDSVKSILVVPGMGLAGMVMTPIYAFSAASASFKSCIKPLETVEIFSYLFDIPERDKRHYGDSPCRSRLVRSIHQCPNFFRLHALAFAVPILYTTGYALLQGGKYIARNSTQEGIASTILALSLCACANYLENRF